MTISATPDQPLEFLGSKEGGPAGYGAVNNGVSNDMPGVVVDFPKMTLKEVLEGQRGEKHERDFYHVGMYQFSPDTLKETIAKTDLDVDTTFFTPEVQDRLALELMLGDKPLGSYLRGESDDIDGAITALARRFASFPVSVRQKGSRRIVKPGESYYVGRAGNNAGHTVEETKAMLQALRRNLGTTMAKNEDGTLRSAEAVAALRSLRDVVEEEQLDLPLEENPSNSLEARVEEALKDAPANPNDPTNEDFRAGAVGAGFVPADLSIDDVKAFAGNVADKVGKALDLNKEVITETLPAVVEKISDALPEGEDVVSFAEKKFEEVSTAGLRTGLDLYRFISSDETRLNPQHLTAWAYYLGVYTAGKKLGLDMAVPQYSESDLTPEELNAVKQATQSAKQEGRNNIEYKDWGGEDEAWTGFEESTVGKQLSNSFYSMKNFLGRARVVVEEGIVYVEDTYNFNDISQDDVARKLWNEGNVIEAAEKAVEDGGSLIGGLRLLSGIIGADIPEDSGNVRIKLGTEAEVFGGAPEKAPEPRQRS